MEENTKAELHLSEEQLQDITGGCGQCLKDMTQIARHEKAVIGYDRLIMNAVKKNNYKLADLALDLRAGHEIAIKNLNSTINARKTTPGHIEVKP